MANNKIFKVQVQVRNSQPDEVETRVREYTIAKETPKQYQCMEGRINKDDLDKIKKESIHYKDYYVYTLNENMVSEYFETMKQIILGEIHFELDRLQKQKEAVLKSVKKI